MIAIEEKPLENCEPSTLNPQPSTRETLPPHVKKFRLGIANDCADAPYGFQRIWYGLQLMSREDPRLEIKQLPPYELGFEFVMNVGLLGLDGLMIENPRSQRDGMLLAAARHVGVPVWCDWGDDILNVGIHNPVANGFTDLADMRKWLERLINDAHVATVPTEPIRKTFPGSNRLALLGGECAVPRSERARRKFISWRGMSSHLGDVMSVLPDLVALFKDPQFADWNIIIFGDPPTIMLEQLALAAGEDPMEVLQGLGKRILRIPPLPTVLHMYSHWEKFAPFVHIVPLEDTPFNRAKNANAWLEATGIGAAVIGPEWCPEWHQPGLIHYGKTAVLGQHNFGEVLRRELVRFKPMQNVKCKMQNGETDPEVYGEMHPAVEAAREAVFPHLTTVAMNRKRWAILRKLVECGEKLRGGSI